MYDQDYDRLDIVLAQRNKMYILVRKYLTKDCYKRWKDNIKINLTKERSSDFGLGFQ